MSRQSGTATLIRDNNSQPIQALACETDAAVLTASGTTARVAIPSNCSIVEIACLTAVHIRFGNSSVDATTSDRVLPAGAVVVYTVPETDNLPATHVAFLMVSGASAGICSVGAMR